MLRKLHIQNYAIIEELGIDFSVALNIITGETGAGKSILMGALSLILGERADTSVLLNNSKKCVIEGFFEVSQNEAVNLFLKEQDIDADLELVLRREIAPNGKTRAFINDTPVTLQQLKQLASLLVDLHQQFDTLELGEADFQREVLDALASNQALLKQYRDLFHALQNTRQHLADLKAQQQQFQKEKDYHQFLFDELDEIRLQPNELENIEQELQLLSNAENIKTALGQVTNVLSNSDTPLVQQLKQLVHQLQAYRELHTQLPELISRLQASQIELQDIADELDSINDSVHMDEQRMQVINDRMAAGYKLLKKHQVQTTEELLNIQQNLSDKLQAVLAIDDEINAAEKEAARLLAAATELAKQLTKQRQSVVKNFVSEVNTRLHQVGMPNAAIQVNITPTDLQEDGADNIAYLFDANKSGRFESIRKVASGGELSRLMLCIKSLVAAHIDLPTMIFDEIDTGISGEAAKQVGMIMKQMAAKRQIICITHQPQIAGKAHAHFFVYKAAEGDRIKTNIRLLTEDERITTIAQMLSGEKPTAAALANAREMIMN
ncbi:MAG: DNA repair protein RecN [Chitinophagales bacterium]|nr:DNA repair protein RecN [Chitinophagales bacterium]